MANIAQFLQAIREARYGKDVRSSIVNAIDTINTQEEGHVSVIEQYTEDAEAWAKGTKNGVEVESTDPTYQNNSKYYSEQAAVSETGAEHFYNEILAIVQTLSNAIIAKGTIAFADLPNVSNPAVMNGFMYNISDNFTTTSDFVEGPGLNIPMGANVYKVTINNVPMWDILAGSSAAVFVGTEAQIEQADRDGLISENTLIVSLYGEADATLTSGIMLHNNDSVENVLNNIITQISHFGSDFTQISESIESLENNKLNKSDKNGYDYSYSDTSNGISAHVSFMHQQLNSRGVDGYIKFIIWTSEGTYEGFCHTYTQWTAGLLQEVGGVRQFSFVTNGSNYTNVVYNISISDVINNLTSTATNRPLSAAQGKTLSEAKVNRAGDTMTGQLNVPGVL